MDTKTNKAVDLQYEPTRIGMGVKALKKAFLDNLYYIQGRSPDVAMPNDNYQALAYTVRDRMLHRWITTSQTFKHSSARSVCFLSAEFLLGPHLGNNLINLGIMDKARQAMEELGIELDDLLAQEEEPGLGNGGLGRLAACYMDSMATLQVPSIGYGIRYEFGIFTQSIKDGWQVETTDKWLNVGNPWELPRSKLKFCVKLGGHTEHFTDDAGNHRVLWIAAREVFGLAYDTPVLGYHVDNVNLLRLWSAVAPESFDFKAFNVGDYYRAVEQKIASENLTKVLYPNDEPAAGKQLRLDQQYFFVSCSLQDMVRIHLRTDHGMENFHEKYVVQLNDTHPSIAVVELMRLMLDEHHIDWDSAWSITKKTFAYTNHTLLPEALEQWPVKLIQERLPRHLEIIYEINNRFLGEVKARFPDDNELLTRVSVINETGERYVRMAHIAAIGSFAINGVAKLHTELLKNSVLRDFFQIMPEKFYNITNGVTPRRFMVLDNPKMSHLITNALNSDNWISHLDELKSLEDYINDTGFCDKWKKVKQANKNTLAKFILKESNVLLDPETLFDVQVKRIHEYKRQHLNLLHIVTLYHRIKEDPNIEITPRTFIFAGKAAPGYFMAKLIIKLINSIAEVINNDPTVNQLIKVVFAPNYNVKTSQWIYPAADLSEQISLAGKEASGTGNMKFSLNGALTIGTLDGSNVEIREAVGEDNFFLFGLTEEEVLYKKSQGYQPMEIYQNNYQLRAVLDLMSSGLFSRGDSWLFKPFVDSLLQQDEYMLLADYESYLNQQTEVGHAFRQTEQWTKKSILNVARCGMFSSDRAIREYSKKIWRVEQIPIEL